MYFLHHHQFIATAPGTIRKRRKRGSAYSQVKTDIGSACITHCDFDLAPALASALALVPVLARAWHPCLAVFLPGPAILASAAYAGLALAVAAAYDLELSGVPVVERPGSASERLCLPFAVTERAGRLDHSAGVALNAGYPAALHLSLQALPALPAEQALFALPDSVAALRGHAAGNDNSAFEDSAAA